MPIRSPAPPRVASSSKTSFFDDRYIRKTVLVEYLAFLAKARRRRSHFESQLSKKIRTSPICPSFNHLATPSPSRLTSVRPPLQANWKSQRHSHMKNNSHEQRTREKNKLRQTTVAPSSHHPSRKGRGCAPPNSKETLPHLCAASAPPRPSCTTSLRSRSPNFADVRTPKQAPGKGEKPLIFRSKIGRFFPKKGGCLARGEKPPPLSPLLYIVFPPRNSPRPASSSKASAGGSSNSQLAHRQPSFLFVGRRHARPRCPPPLTNSPNAWRRQPPHRTHDRLASRAVSGNERSADRPRVSVSHNHPPGWSASWPPSALCFLRSAFPVTTLVTFFHYFLNPSESLLYSQSASPKIRFSVFAHPAPHGALKSPVGYYHGISCEASWLNSANCL